MIKGNIRVGDVVIFQPPNAEMQLIEVLGTLPAEGAIHYWTDENPEQVWTTKCKGMDAWLLFKYGTRLGNVGWALKHPIYTAKYPEKG